MNIALFGSELNNVTIFGQSSSVMIVAALYAYPDAQDLFSEAIISSYPDKRKEIKYGRIIQLVY